MNHWIVQANPKRYDVRAALEALSGIEWRIPQYTSEVRPGDAVIIWESGDQVGIVGVGRIAGIPREAASPEAEAEFRLDDERETVVATRARIAAKPVDFVPKAQVSQLPEMADHPIVVAPMGTVFPLSEEQWQALVEAIPGLLAVDAILVPDVPDDWPHVYAWADRRKAVQPLPGGYEAYPRTLATIFSHVRDIRPERSELERWLETSFSVSSRRAQYGLDFLTRVGLLTSAQAGVDLTPESTRWLDERSSDYLIAVLHSRLQLIGELLEFINAPRSPEELLHLANIQYAMGWNTRAQIDRRRYWLQGFGMIEADDDGLVIRTRQGDELVQRLSIQEPTASGAIDLVDEPLTVRDTAETTAVVPARPKLATDLAEAAGDSSNPDRFEKLTARAFLKLGFESTWLGGSGKTDVLLIAPLGPREGYRAIVDCKTTSHEGVQDQQVDWMTLQEHKTQHDADYVAVVAFAFKGSRIRERAAKEGVSLIDVETLIGALRQHTATPLGLDTYRTLFTSDSLEDAVSHLAESADEVDRWQRLVANTVAVLAKLEVSEGAMTARDLYWNIKRVSDEDIPVSVDEIQHVLDALASPAIGVLRSIGDAYKTLGSAETSTQRFAQLTRALNKLPSEPEPGATE